MNSSVRRVAVLGGIRIPFARQNGPYAQASNQDMLTTTLDALADKFRLRGAVLGEVAAGAVLKHSRDFNLTRESVLGSKLAPETPAYDVQQACGTGLEAAILVANKIALGQIDSGIAGGVDTTSDAPLALNENLRTTLLSVNRAKSPVQRAKALTRIRPQHVVPGDPAQRRAAHRPVDGRARGDHGRGVGDHTRGSGRARGREPPQARGSLRPGLPRRPRQAVPRTRARPEPAARLEHREARQAQAGVRRRGGDDDRRQLDAAVRRRLGGAAGERGVGRRTRAARCWRTSRTPRPPPSTTCTSARAC